MGLFLCFFLFFSCHQKKKSVWKIKDSTVGWTGKKKNRRVVDEYCYWETEPTGVCVCASTMQWAIWKPSLFSKSSGMSRETIVERRFAQWNQHGLFVAVFFKEKRKKKRVKSGLMLSVSSKATESTKECLSGSLSGSLGGNALHKDIGLNDASMSLHTI